MNILRGFYEELIAIQKEPERDYILLDRALLGKAMTDNSWWSRGRRIVEFDVRTWSKAALLNFRRHLWQ